MAEPTEMTAQMKALQSTDLTPMIRMSGLMVPRVLKVFMDTLSPKEKAAFDKAMPVGGTKKIFIHLVGTPTPPIVIGFAQPMLMTTMTETEVKDQKLKGIRLSLQDVQLATQKKMGKLLFRNLSQLGVMLGLTSSFTPFLKLGPKGIMDLKDKAMKHFKPLMDMMPH